MSSTTFPPFVHQERLLQGLEKRFNANLEVVKVNSDSNDTGTHVISAVDFIVVTVRDKTTKKEQDVNLFVKYVCPNAEKREDFDAAFDSPDKELVFLGKVFPAIKQFCDEEPVVGERVKLENYPYCYYAGGDEYKSIVLENVGLQGFKHHPANIGQDEQHARWVLKCMAEFHAASFLYLKKTKNKIVEENPLLQWQFFSPLVKGLFEKQLTDIYRIGISVLNVPEHKEKYELLSKLTPIYFERSRLLSDTDSRFNVICFGDCWNNNIFFKYNEEGKIVDLRFIDFQLGHFDTMFYDLFMYVLSSTDYTFWEKGMTPLLRCYYDSFNETLKKFKGVDDCGFTFATLLDEFHRRLPAAFQVIFQLSALRLLPQGEIIVPGDGQTSTVDGGLMDDMVAYVKKVTTLESTKEKFTNRLLSMYNIGERGIKNLIEGEQ